MRKHVWVAAPTVAAVAAALSVGLGHRLGRGSSIREETLHQLEQLRRRTGLCAVLSPEADQ